MTRTVLAAATALATCLSGALPSRADQPAADTLAKVRAAGVLRCGANGASEDYTRLDSHGDLTDLAEEICRAVAVAVLGPDGKADVHEWPDEQHMMASLHAGSTDLAIGVAPTVAVATGFDAAFGPPVFYDGQGLLAANAIGSLEGLADQQICFVDDATLGETLRAAMQARGIAYKPFPFEEVGEMLAAAAGGHCAAITGNLSQLINLRTGYAPIEKRFRLLPDILTSDPVAPAVRADDRRWEIIVTAVVDALIQAEEVGLTASNAEQMTTSEDPVVRQMIGAHGAGHMLGLADDWALTVVKTVGNYGDIFRRTLGADSDFKLPRGANQPWSHGGVMVAPPLY